MLKSIYDINENGIVDNAEKTNNHTVEADVPSDAQFTDTTYEIVTEEKDGLMSIDDKLKLDGIEDEANNYELPIASSDVLGGIKVGNNLNVDDDGTLNADGQAYDVASDTSDGLMSSSDKTKLDGIATGANKTVVENVLTSTSTTNALSAAQGKALNDKILGYDTVESW